MRRLVLCLMLFPLLALAACGGLSKTGNGGYLVGNGQVMEFKPADRGAPVDLSGTTLDGKPYYVKDDLGKVVVINTWWSLCGPCNTEMPMLERLHQSLGDSVAFVGLNIRDTSADNGIAFEKGHGVTYPSIYSPGGQGTLAFSAKVSPRTIPSTAVLDAQGRVAAIIRGAISGNQTLADVIQDVQKSE